MNLLRYWAIQNQRRLSLSGATRVQPLYYAVDDIDAVDSFSRKNVTRYTQYHAVPRFRQLRSLTLNLWVRGSISSVPFG